MKRITVIRHGEAGSEYKGKDKERALTSKGKEQIARTAKKLKTSGSFPEIVLCSTALRTISSIRKLGEVLSFSPGNIVYEEGLYLASFREILFLVNNLDNSYQSILICGHNPGITDFCNYVCNSNLFPIPEAAMIELNFEFDDWNMISGATGSLERFHTP